MPKSINKEDLKDIRKNEISNLKFLDKFIKMRKLTKPQFAELIGMTKANVYHWFKVDDIMLKTLNNAFDKIGYEVIFKEIKWESKYTDLNAGTIDCIWNGFTCNTADDDEEDMPKPDPIKSLDFLRHALYDNDIDQNALAKKLGIDVETIDYWFRHDNCFVSYIFRIAKYTKMKLKVDIRPKDQN